VADYQNGVESGTNYYSENIDPPLSNGSRKGKHGTLGKRALINLAKGATKVLNSWKVTKGGSGLREPSVAYIVTHLKELKLHLQAHFPGLKRKFEDYVVDRLRRAANVAAQQDVHQPPPPTANVAARQDVHQTPPPTPNDVLPDYASDSDASSLNDVVQFPVAAGPSSDAASMLDAGIAATTTHAGSCHAVVEDRPISDDDTPFCDAVVEDRPISDDDTSFCDESGDERDVDDYVEAGEESLDIPEDGRPVRTQLTLRQVFEIIKATVPLNDSQCSKMLKIFKNAFPEWRKKEPHMWARYVTDGALLAAPCPEYLKQKKLRKVVCALTKDDFVPFHDPEKRKEMLDLYEKTGSTIKVTEKTTMGDMLDFDVEKSLLLESPATLDPGAYIKLLEKVNAARPNLLSPHLLFIVDKGKFNDEQLKPNPERPKMNLFSLKLHSDGVQIAKNASLPECSPISFTIERIYPFDPLTGARDDAKSLRIPSTMPAVHTISVYHGKGACCLFQYMEHMKSELCRLSPSLNNVKNKDDYDRKLVVEHLLTIADSVERSKRTGE
jgi:hypothetical protein